MILDRENVRSSDCARFESDRGLEKWSLIFDSNSESDPRLVASSWCLARPGTPDPFEPAISRCAE